MKSVLADAGYWIALLNPRDQLHIKAKTVSASLGPVWIVTSEMVLAEVLNYFATKGSELRRAAVVLVEKLQSNPNVIIVPQTNLQFQDAFALYRSREDKGWSLTDCASILIMQAEGIDEALTYDQHFVQAGFKALLRDED
jgi:predicted nucleic acid-binding protein